jgi:hypothetical protein
LFDAAPALGKVNFQLTPMSGLMSCMGMLLLFGLNVERQGNHCRHYGATDPFHNTPFNN